MTRLVWSATIVLALLGVVAGMGRAVIVGDLAARAEPARLRMVDALQLDDPRKWERDAELRRYDSPYAAHPVMARLHVVPGAIFLALAPFQFVRRIRTRYPALHRWNGRLLIVTAFVGLAAAFFFGLFLPFGGVRESAAIVVFGGLFGFSLARGFLEIRRGRRDLHREWMIRAFAVALAISTARVIATLTDLTLSPLGVSVRDGFVISIWAGWLLTVGVAEIWIRRTRVGGSKRTRPASMRASVVQV